MRTLDLTKLQLEKGSHDPNDGHRMCVMEAVAYVAGEPWSDQPQCASRVLGAFLRTYNDQVDHATRQSLVPYIYRLAGSRATEEIEQRRSFMAGDWLIRIHLPAWLHLAGLPAEAGRLAAFPEITNAADLLAVQPLLDEAKKTSADAALAAVLAGALAAVLAGARDAAWARDAARAGALAGAWDAARAGSLAGARDEALAALVPITQQLQALAPALIERMLSASTESEG